MQAALGVGLSVRSALGAAHAFYLTPNVNRGGTPADRMGWADRYQLVFCLIAGLVVPPLVLFPQVVVYLLYAPSFVPGAPFVVLFVLCELLYLVSGTYQSLVIALDRMRFHFVSNLVAQLAVVACASQLIGALGILGVGLAVLLAPIILLVSTTVFLRRAYGLRLPREVVMRSGWLVLSVGCAGAAGAFLDLASPASLAAKGFIYSVGVLGFAWLLTGDEHARIREMSARWKKRWIDRP
jgi:O-antigen/teichoic acid export membrane protein